MVILSLRCPPPSRHPLPGPPALRSPLPRSPLLAPSPLRLSLPRRHPRSPQPRPPTFRPRSVGRTGGPGLVALCPPLFALRPPRPLSPPSPAWPPLAPQPLFAPSAFRPPPPTRRSPASRASSPHASLALVLRSPAHWPFRPIALRRSLPLLSQPHRRPLHPIPCPVCLPRKNEKEPHHTFSLTAYW